jgi:general L-amino acid transport system permease protein
MKRRLHLGTAAWIILALIILWPVTNWGLIHAVWHADLPACREARGLGACWGVIAEKHRMLLFGRYPFDEQWRACLATLLIVTMLLMGCWRRLWNRFGVASAAVMLAAAVCLMAGGVAGLSPVPTKEWGGLPLTLLISLGGTLLAFPFAILLALGRRSALPLLRSLCTIYIELVRGVPLISLLFLAAFLFPMLLPPSVHIDILPRVILTIAGFGAAYLAEVIRAGLQAIPASQAEAARALGMREWQLNVYIILPQALRTALPALVNNFVGIFKDTSLISIVSLHELTGALAISLGGDADWRSFYLEGYLFVASVYWVFCFGISRFARSMEKRLQGSRQASSDPQR